MWRSIYIPKHDQRNCIRAIDTFGSVSSNAKILAIYVLLNKAILTWRVICLFPSRRIYHELSKLHLTTAESVVTSKKFETSLLIKDVKMLIDHFVAHVSVIYLKDAMVCELV